MAVSRRSKNIARALEGPRACWHVAVYWRRGKESGFVYDSTCVNDVSMRLRPSALKHKWFTLGSNVR